MTPSWIIFIGCLLGPVITALVVSCLCARSILRDERPSWLYVPVSLGAGLFGSLWLILGDDVFYPAGWSDRISSHQASFVIALVESAFFDVVVGLFAVSLFQQRYRTHLSLRERNLAHRQRKKRSQRRRRCLFLLASGTLIAVFSTCLTLCWSEPSYPGVGEVGDPSALTSNPDTPAEELAEQAKLAPLKASHWRYSMSAAPYLWPVWLAGLLASGTWFAYTVAYWRGNADWRLKWR